MKNNKELETILDRLVNVDPSKKSLKFLRDRLKSENYRGIQISQHNRYELSDILVLLDTMYDLVKKEKMDIRTTDIKERPYNLPNERIYANYCNDIFKKMGRGTQDSIRKNLFVDLHRMGFIDRFNKKGDKILPYKRGLVSSVSITELGLELINKKKTILDRQIVFSEGIDAIMKGFASKLIDILSELGNISLDEYTFFVSFTDKTLNGYKYSSSDILELVKDFRSMSRLSKDKVVDIVKEYADPNNFKGDKKQKRDYHNWLNESQQVFYLLNQTAYYEYDSSKKIMTFRVGSDKNKSLFNQDEIKKLKRSTKAKLQYFVEHDIEKRKGYELHHVVPLLKARNATHFFLLDVWQNLLYIDAKTHAIITQNGNKQIKMNILDNNDITLTDLEDELLIKFNDQVFYSVLKRDVMLKKNVELLKII